MGYANKNGYTAKITGATTNTQIFVAPWRIRKRYILKKLIVTNEGAANIVKFFDDDLGDATTPARGDNANAPLLEFMVPATTTLTLTSDQLPFVFFQGGMVGHATVANVVVSAEIEED